MRDHDADIERALLEQIPGAARCRLLLRHVERLFKKGPVRTQTIAATMVQRRGARLGRRREDGGLADRSAE
jgi:hypothetical protein